MDSLTIIQKSFDGSNNDLVKISSAAQNINSVQI